MHWDAVCPLQAPHSLHKQWKEGWGEVRWSWACLCGIWFSPLHRACGGWRGMAGSWGIQLELECPKNREPVLSLAPPSSSCVLTFWETYLGYDIRVLEEDFDLCSFWKPEWHPALTGCCEKHRRMSYPTAASCKTEQCLILEITQREWIWELEQHGGGR